MAAVAQPPGVDTDSATAAFSLGCHKNRQRILDSHAMGMDVRWGGREELPKYQCIFTVPE